MKNKTLTLAIASATMSLSTLASAAEFEISITNLTAGVHFTPLIVSAHSANVAMFNVGHEASTQLQSIAEGGDVSGLAALLESVGASVATSDGLLAPGATTTVKVNSSDTNTVLSFAGMLLPTNDGFVGLNSVTLPGGMGTSSHYVARGYDAGTEANDEVVGSGAPGEAGFPAPPPVVATGTGTGGTGIPGHAEGFITVHRGVLGDLDPHGGYSDINAAIHRWNNPVASISINMIDGGNANGPSVVGSLTGQVYSSSAVEIFWQPAASDDSIVTTYEIRRNGDLVASINGQSFFDDGLRAGVEYTYNIRAIDANGNAGAYQSIDLRTNSN